MNKSVFRLTVFFVATVLLLVVFSLLDVFTGSVNIPVSRILALLAGQGTGDTQWDTIILNIRLPRLITAIIAGASLSVSGLLMQTVFRNPLAGPYVLGISSGAGLGVAVLLLGADLLGLGLMAGNGQWAMIFSAIAGSGLVLVLVMAVSARVKDILTILILGIMFGSAASAIISILQYFSNASQLKTYILWTLGSLESTTGAQLSVLLPLFGFGLFLAVAAIKSLDVMLLGEQYASTSGINIGRTRFLVFASTSILAGAVTAFCGPIGFVGIAVPHVCRMLLNTNSHRLLIPASVLFGAMVMVFSDVVSQMPGQQFSLPINSVTALLGIPVIVWIVLRRSGGRN